MKYLTKKKGEANILVILIIIVVLGFIVYYVADSLAEKRCSDTNWKYQQLQYDYNKLNQSYFSLNQSYFELSQNYTNLNQNYTQLKNECGQALKNYEACIGRENFFTWVNRFSSLLGLAKLLGI